MGTGTGDFVERRRHERVSVDFYVNWGWTDDCPRSERVFSISVGGCFIRTNLSAERGRRLFIDFPLPGSGPLEAEVRYQIKDFGLGVEFKGVTASQGRMLAHMVEHFPKADQQRRGRIDT